jgi:hypothetical protein
MRSEEEQAEIVKRALSISTWVDRSMPRGDKEPGGETVCEPVQLTGGA